MFKKLLFMQNDFGKHLTQTKYDKRSEMTETKLINANQSFFSNQITSQNIIQTFNNSNDLDKIDRTSHNQLKLSSDDLHKIIKMLQDQDFCQMNINIEQTRISALTVIILIITPEIAPTHSIQTMQDLKRTVSLRPSCFKIKSDHDSMLMM